MKRWIAVTLIAAMTAAVASCQDVVFRKSRIFGKRARVDLVFLDQDKALEVRNKSGVVEHIPLDKVDEFSYGHSKRRRWSEALQVFSLNANSGLLIFLTLPITVLIAVPMMFTKETKHRLTVDFSDAEAPRKLVLQLYKSEYGKVLATIQTRTDKTVVMLPETKKR